MKSEHMICLSSVSILDLVDNGNNKAMERKGYCNQTVEDFSVC